MASENIKQISEEKKWRQNYAHHFVAHVQSAAEWGGEDALAMAKGGLDKLYKEFVFVRDNKTVSLSQAMERVTRDPRRSLETREIKGRLSFGEKDVKLAVPVGNGEILSGERLEEKVKDWANRDVIEPSAVPATKFAMNFIQSKDGWQKERKNHAFVVLGAGAAIGPTKQLLALGATVIAVDLHNRPKVWSKLLKVSRESPGTLIVPLRKHTEGATMGDEKARFGCNLLSEGPEIADWLVNVCPNMDITIGSYAYLDGKNFVRIVLAMDAISQYVIKHRKGKVNIAYLASPSDIYLRPKITREKALQRYTQRPLWFKGAHTISGGRLCQPNICGNLIQGQDFDVVDASVSQQGPNYLLAKRIQQWRAILARNHGTAVSINIAPASATMSVMKNSVLRAAYKGVSAFPPMEVFPPGTTNSIMAAALIRDTFDKKSPADPRNKIKLRHPLLLLADNAWHGGLWSTSVRNKSAAELAAVIGFIHEKSPYIQLGAGLGGAYVASSYLGLFRSKL
eukprot:CAMPEP_0184482286 /NCGR_PEP_ID=MMETSP0113_2-20130426/3846_1 /TAXON_ID=91329 /ORGANISM="Norrisiella sphaerica, Strain BC52" /LENGTH=509 /DNA_ID=CAMNT_0026861927 /DNA_START=210 /DNA_END=1739 /DNA_ORIENTATION=+